MSKASTKLLDRANIYTLVPFDYSALGDDALEARAREAADKIKDLQRGAVVDIGRELLAMKEALPHGQFDNWVENEFNWSKRTALNYMQVAREFGDKYATVAHLPPAVIYQLASPSTPSVVREAVTQVKDGHQISVNSVKSMISEVKSRELKKEIRADHKEREAEEERQTGLTRQQRWEAQYAKQMAETKIQDAKADEAVDRLKFWLGGYYPEFRELMQTVDHHRFCSALSNRLKQDGYSGKFNATSEA